MVLQENLLHFTKLHANSQSPIHTYGEVSLQLIAKVVPVKGALSPLHLYELGD